MRRRSDVASSYMQMWQLWPLDTAHYALLLPTPCTSYSASAYALPHFSNSPSPLFFFFFLTFTVHMCIARGGFSCWEYPINWIERVSFYINTSSQRNTPTTAGSRWEDVWLWMSKRLGVNTPLAQHIPHYNSRFSKVRSQSRSCMRTRRGLQVALCWDHLQLHKDRWS